MYVWEWQLLVLRSACEFRLDQYRTRHSELTVDRNRSPFKGPAWETKSEKMALLRQFIYRELDEIKHIKQRANAGPIKGGTMVLHVRDGKTHKVRPGPSIIELMQREADKYRTKGDAEEDDGLKGMADGIDLALEILINPYRFLDKDEQVAYDEAESNADKIISESGRQLASREDRAPTARTAPALPTAAALRAEGAQIVRRPGKS